MIWGAATAAFSNSSKRVDASLKVQSFKDFHSLAHELGSEFDPAGPILAGLWKRSNSLGIMVND